MRNFGTALLTGAMVVGLATGAHAVLDSADLKCETAMGKNLGKLVAAENKCITGCLSGVSKGVGAYADCQPPYGGAAAFCLGGKGDILKSPGVKATVAINKVCLNQAEPACYSVQSSGTTADEVDRRIGLTDAVVNTFVGNVVCEDFVTTLDKAKYKCATTVAKILVKQLATDDKAYAKCYANALKGVGTINACKSSATDPATVAAIQKGITKSAAGIDKACFIAPAVAPTCYDGSPSRPNTGAGWLALLNNAIHEPGQTTRQTYCESPSGAFID